MDHIRVSDIKASSVILSHSNVLIKPSRYIMVSGPTVHYQWHSSSDWTTKRNFCGLRYTLSESDLINDMDHSHRSKLSCQNASDF